MADDIAAAPTAGTDEQRLHELGYAQELMRRMSGFSNFAVSFTIISILSGCLTLYGYGMNTGGPAIIVWGWPIVGIMTLIVGLAMAEVCSSFPTAGGLYYWAAKLARAQRPGLVLVHRLVQLPRPGRGHRGHRLRRAFFINAFLNLSSAVTTAHWHDDPDPRDRAVRARLMNQFGIRLVALLERRQRLVAHRRRADHRGRGRFAFVALQHASASYVFSTS